ncbi:MAG: Ig-like domain-containing protein, partial [Oscillospiraceae bacterium]|nr:Ig-like domain-containing protein [Oscillospiraceae bacterium]
MRRQGAKWLAVLVAVTTVSLFLPAASAAALSYSLAPTTVNLDANQSGSFQITVQPDAPFGGVDFLVSLPAAVEITDVSYNVSGTIGAPGQKGAGIYFGVTNLMTNAYTGPLVCTVNIRYTGTGTASSDVVISEVRLSTYTGKTGADSIDTRMVSPSGGGKVTVVPNTAPSAEPAVLSVTVTPASASVTKGATQQFAAAVAVANGAAQSVTWQVTGGAAGTGISADGLLTVAAGETAAALQVTATSTFDTTKKATVPVTVLAPGGSDPGSSDPGGSTGGGTGGGSSSGGNAGGGATEAPDPETPLAQVFPFTDVSEGDWFYGDVYYMWENSLMNGTSATLFSPGRTLTRGMVVT